MLNVYSHASANKPSDNPVLIDASLSIYPSYRFNSLHVSIHLLSIQRIARDVTSTGTFHVHFTLAKHGCQQTLDQGKTDYHLAS